LISFDSVQESETNKATQAGTQIVETVAQEKLIERTSKDFTDGVCSGYLTYYDEYKGKQLTDLDVYAFLIQNITDVRGTDQFNAGYCTGWIEALIEDRQILNSVAGRRKDNGTIRAKAKSKGSR